MCVVSQSNPIIPTAQTSVSADVRVCESAPTSEYAYMPPSGLVVISKAVPRPLMNTIGTISQILATVLEEKAAATFLESAEFAFKRWPTDSEPALDPKVAATLWDLVKVTYNTSWNPKLEASDASFMRAWSKSLNEHVSAYSISFRNSSVVMQLETQTACALAGKSSETVFAVILPGTSLFKLRQNVPAAPDSVPTLNNASFAGVHPWDVERKMRESMDEQSFRVRVSAVATGLCLFATGIAMGMSAQLWALGAGFAAAGSLFALISSATKYSRAAASVNRMVQHRNAPARSEREAE